MQTPRTDSLKVPQLQETVEEQEELLLTITLEKEAMTTQAHTLIRTGLPGTVAQVILMPLTLPALQLLIPITIPRLQPQIILVHR
jgi:hypothetical protein